MFIEDPYLRAPDTSRLERIQRETPYTVREVAALTGFSEQTVTRLFEDESGVLIIERSTTRNKRRYRSIRIPHPVYQRVILRLSTRSRYSQRLSRR